MTFAAAVTTSQALTDQRGCTLRGVTSSVTLTDDCVGSKRSNPLGALICDDVTPERGSRTSFGI